MKNCEPLVSGPMLAIERRPTWGETSSQAPSYASPKLSPTHSLTGVKCRATSVAKKVRGNTYDMHQTHYFSTIAVFCAIYLVMLLDKALVIEEFSVDGLTTITITAFEVSPLSWKLKLFEDLVIYMIHGTSSHKDLEHELCDYSVELGALVAKVLLSCTQGPK